MNLVFFISHYEADFFSDYNESVSNKGENEDENDLSTKHVC